MWQGRFKINYLAHAPSWRVYNEEGAYSSLCQMKGTWLVSLVDNTHCSRTLCWEAPRLCHPHKQISCQPAGFCWWKLSWSQDNISWACMGHSGVTSTTKGFFCTWKAVSDTLHTALYYLSFLRFSVLPAISLDGFLHCEIVEGSFRSETFALFIQNLLDHMQPFPGPNSVIVMDNCRIHKTPFIQELIQARCVYSYASYSYWQPSQRYAVRILATIFSRLQPNRACFLVHEV
jgi:DDE superfamily endonuclease